MQRKVVAVIPAAGESTRMGSERPDFSKIFANLSENRTVLDYVLQSVVDSGVCAGIIVVTRESDLARAEYALGKLSGLSWHKALIGGASRQESVWNALSVIDSSVDFVLIHDGARPCCSAELIRQVALRGMESAACILGSPLSDTLKRMETTEIIAATVPRGDLVCAQTPQVFSLELLLSAHRQAQREGYLGTDESELVERFGATVSVVSGNSWNIKITNPEDLNLARVICQLKDQ